MQPRLLLLSLALSWSATAQNPLFTAYPLDNPASSTSQNIPIAGNNAAWDEARSQFLFPAAFLPGAGVLTAIEWVANINGTTPYQRFEIWLDHTTSSTLSATFASNLTAPQLVYAQSPGSITWVGGAWNTIQFQTPFVHDGQRNIVMEIRKQIDRVNNPPTATVSQRVLVWPRRTDLPVPIWAYGAFGSGMVDAATATTSYTTQILTRFQWQGQRTLTINSTRDVTGNSARAYFHLGATITTTVQGTPGEFEVSAIDAAFAPVPVSLPGINGNLWLFGPSTFAVGTIDPAGLSAHTTTIPNDTALIGLRVLFQSAVLGTGIQLTNVVDAPIAAF